MRSIIIKADTGTKGWKQLRQSWQKHKWNYCQEAVGLGIFMISACYFGAMLEGLHSPLHSLIPGSTTRLVLMGVLMGLTALFIFYSPVTAPSGAHINPAVTITFYRLGKMCHWDAMFYILFQVTGGTLAVYLAAQWMGTPLTAPPVEMVVTVPGHPGIAAAFITEFLIAFVTMSVVLYTSGSDRLGKYTRVIVACLVCIWVIAAGPISGFGMNPARSFASAIIAQKWTAFWIYVFGPLSGMLLAAELHTFLQTKKHAVQSSIKKEKTSELIEPLEFLL